MYLNHVDCIFTKVRQYPVLIEVVEKNNLSWSFFTDASHSVHRVSCGIGMSGYCLLSKRDAAFMCLSERLAPSYSSTVVAAPNMILGLREYHLIFLLL